LTLTLCACAESIGS